MATPSNLTGETYNGSYAETIRVYGKQIEETGLDPVEYEASRLGLAPDRFLEMKYAHEHPGDGGLARKEYIDSEIARLAEKMDCTPDEYRAHAQFENDRKVAEVYGRGEDSQYGVGSGANTLQKNFLGNTVGLPYGTDEQARANENEDLRQENEQLREAKDEAEESLDKQQVSDSRQYDNIFGRDGSTVGEEQFAEAIELHAEDAKAMGLTLMEFEAGLKGMSVEDMYGDLYDHMYAAGNLAEGTVPDKQQFIDDAMEADAKEHGMTLAEYQEKGDALVKDTMDANPAMRTDSQGSPYTYSLYGTQEGIGYNTESQQMANKSDEINGERTAAAKAADTTESSLEGLNDTEKQMLDNLESAIDAKMPGMGGVMTATLKEIAHEAQVGMGAATLGTAQTAAHEQEDSIDLTDEPQTTTADLDLGR